MDALHDHFDRTGTHLSPEQISEMTALDLETVHEALRVLYKMGAVEGTEVAEVLYPVQVTGIRYEAA